MKNYTVKVTEVSYINVPADSEDEAMDAVYEKINDGEDVFDDSEISYEIDSVTPVHGRYSMIQKLIYKDNTAVYTLVDPEKEYMTLQLGETLSFFEPTGKIVYAAELVKLVNSISDVVSFMKDIGHEVELAYPDKILVGRENGYVIENDLSFRKVD